MQSGSVSPHCCSILLLMGAWSIASVLFGFNFASITCSSRKNDQQIFAAPSLVISCLGPSLHTCPLGRLHRPLDVLSWQTWWISLVRAYNHVLAAFLFLILIRMCWSFSSSLLFGCPSPCLLFWCWIVYILGHNLLQFLVLKYLSHLPLLYLRASFPHAHCLLTSFFFSVYPLCSPV